MAVTTPARGVAGQPPQRAPAGVQARRVFCLARLLTGATAVVCVVAHVAVIVWLRLRPGGDVTGWDAWMVDVRYWAGIFAFWAVVMWLARRPLRLDRWR